MNKNGTPLEDIIFTIKKFSFSLWKHLKDLIVLTAEIYLKTSTYICSTAATTTFPSNNNNFLELFSKFNYYKTTRACLFPYCFYSSWIWQLAEYIVIRVPCDYSGEIFWTSIIFCHYAFQASTFNFSVYESYSKNIFSSNLFFYIVSL